MSSARAAFELVSCVPVGSRGTQCGLVSGRKWTCEATIRKSLCHRYVGLCLVTRGTYFGIVDVARDVGPVSRTRKEDDAIASLVCVM